MKERKKPTQSFIARSIEEIEKEAFEKGYEAGKQEMIEKACDWFEDIDFEIQYQYSEDGSTFFDGGKFIEDFRKAMED